MSEISTGPRTHIQEYRMTNPKYKGVTDETIDVWIRTTTEESNKLKEALDKHNLESAENDWDEMTPWWVETRAKIRELGGMHQELLMEKSARNKITAQRNHTLFLQKKNVKGKQFGAGRFESRLASVAKQMLDPETFNALMNASVKEEA